MKKMLQFFKYLFSFFTIFIFTNAFAIQTQWSNGIESQVRIISPLTHTNYQNEMYLGLQYNLQKGWKTYWRSPGDGGFPQKVDWSKSKNIKNIEILWPTPEEFKILGVHSIGYIDEVIFPLKISLKDIKKEVIIILDLNYLTCKDICIPGNANLELVIPSGIGNITEHSYDIEKSLSYIPEKNLNVSKLKNVLSKAYTDGKNVSIKIEATSQKSFTNPKFYLDTKFGLPVVIPKINYSTNFKKINANFLFEKKLFPSDKFNLSVIIKDNNEAYEHSTDVNLEILQEDLKQNKSIIYFFLVALLGGLILNIMPCVLPVLSLKLLSILKNLNESYLIRKSFIVTSLGIVSSFGLLAFTFIVLRSIGVSIGWGMQFQQPLFLMVIALIISVFILNLFGIFEFKTPTFINSDMLLKLNNNNFTKDFFNGFFATILATPCSAPFVGTAITVSFTQSSFIMICIFLSMGLGMASPYLLISLFPSMVKFLPKPGMWMQWLKYFLGLLLFATLIWICFILLNHFNNLLIITFFLLFFSTSLFLKFYKKKLLVGLLSVIIFFILPNFSFFKFDQRIQELDWIDLTTVELNDYIQNNSIVFVDISADWCATCQFNKINVINSSIIKEIFEKNNIIKLRGDWTKPNKQIEIFLQQHNRYGIPLNVMYSSSYPEGIILSELLTIKEITDTLEKIREKK